MNQTPVNSKQAISPQARRQVQISNVRVEGNLTDLSSTVIEAIGEAGRQAAELPTGSQDILQWAEESGLDVSYSGTALENRSFASTQQTTIAHTVVQSEHVHFNTGSVNASALAERIVEVLRAQSDLLSSKNPSIQTIHGQEFQRPPKNEQFVKRRDLIEKMHAHFESSESQSLALTAFGLGGVGKTQLATYYFWESPKAYRLKAWFYAENPKQLALQYVSLGEANGLKFEDQEPLVSKAKKVKAWLETQENILLVYDNVPSVEVIVDWKPAKGNPHILITSRNKTGWGEMLDVDVMTEAEAAELLQKTLKQPFKEEMKELVKTLGYLPLAIVQAGIYIKNHSATISSYLNLYQKCQAELLSDTKLLRGLPLICDHEKLQIAQLPVWITFNLNLQELAETSPIALKVLQSSSFLQSQGIPDILLQLELGFETLQEPTELAWSKVKAALNRYSFMKINSAVQEWSLHPLLQDIVRSQLSNVEQVRVFKALCERVDALFAFYHQKGSMVYRELLPHAERLYSHGQKIADYPEASEIVEVPSLLKGEPNNLGMMYQALGLYQEAVRVLEKLQHLQEAHYGPDHVEVAKTLGNLGTVYGDLRDIPHQKALLERALLIEEKHYGPDHVEVATTLNNLGTAYRDLGDISHQKAFLERALVIKEKHYGPNHVEVAKTLNNLGNAYALLRDFSRQKALLERALEIQEKHYGVEHYEVGSTLCNLGLALSTLERVEEGMIYLQRARSNYQRYFPGGHPNLTHIEKALSYCNRLLSTNNKNLGATSDMQSGGHLPGLLVQFQQQEQEGLRAFREKDYRAADTASKSALILLARLSLSEKEQKTSAAKLHNNLGACCRELEKYQGAIQHFEKALQFQEKLSGKESEAYQRILAKKQACEMKFQADQENQAAVQHFKAQHWKDAQSGFQRVLARNHTFFAGKLHRDVASAHWNLSSCAFQLEQFEEAEQHVQQAYTIRKEILGEAHELTHKALLRLQDCQAKRSKKTLPFKPGFSS